MKPCSSAVRKPTLDGRVARHVLRIEHRPGGKTTPEQARSDVEKFFYVVKGRVRCSIWQELHELRPGDSIYFNSGQAHQIENSGANSAKVLCVVVPLAL